VVFNIHCFRFLSNHFFVFFLSLEIPLFLLCFENCSNPIKTNHGLHACIDLRSQIPFVLCNTCMFTSSSVLLSFLSPSYRLFKVIFFSSVMPSTDLFEKTGCLSKVKSNTTWVVLKQALCDYHIIQTQLFFCWFHFSR